MSLIATTCEAIDPPEVLADTARMTTLAEELALCGYDLSHCASRLGVFPRLGVNFWPALRKKRTPDPDDAVDTMLELFIDGQPVAAERLRKHVSLEFLRVLVETRLADENQGLLQSKFCLFPCYDKYIATDRAAKNTAISQVMWLWGESFLLGGL